MNRKTAIFLGKFQPPHLGHIRTILRISNEYTKFIIGVTEDKKVMDAKSVKEIFDEIFSSFEMIETVIVEGVVENGTAILPNGIDVILSGNQKVLNLLSDKYETKFVERTRGIGYSATEIREASFQANAVPLKNLNQNISMELIEITKLKPLEEVLPSHLRNIQQMIERDRIVKKPIIVDKKNMIVLDGSHRYAYLYEQGYKYAPVILIDYEDESIFVGNHLKHRFLKDENLTISKFEVRDRAINENIYPPRTTRHFFPFRKENFPIELKRLEKGEKRDIDFLLADISLEEEIKIDLGYVTEINEEIATIEKYMQEQYETKDYLLQQIEMMKNEQK